MSIVCLLYVPDGSKWNPLFEAMSTTNTCNAQTTWFQQLTWSHVIGRMRSWSFSSTLFTCRIFVLYTCLLYFSYKPWPYMVLQRKGGNRVLQAPWPSPHVFSKCSTIPAIMGLFNYVSLLQFSHHTILRRHSVILYLHTFYTLGEPSSFIGSQLLSSGWCIESVKYCTIHQTPSSISSVHRYRMLLIP